MASIILYRLSKGGAGAASRLAASAFSRPGQLGCFSSSCRYLIDTSVGPSGKRILPSACHMTRLSEFGDFSLQHFGFSSSSCPQNTEKDIGELSDDKETVGEQSAVSENDSQAKVSSNEEKPSSPVQNVGSTYSRSHSVRRRSAKRIAFSDSDSEPELSIDNLIKLVAEKEELLRQKHKKNEEMQEKVLRSYADMENAIDRAKREAESSKKFAIQTFAKNLLDVADNLSRASSVVKESFSKIDSTKDSTGVVQLLNTLLEGVEMTEKQLLEVFRKFGMEKFDPTNEQFDPHRHHAVFQIPDASKPSGIIAAVLKPGYMLHDRVLRPAEVGVSVAEGAGVEASQNSGD